MHITTLGVGAAVTPTVVKTYISHYANRKPRRQKPTAHISYDEGLHLIRSFLKYASHHTVEDLQAFTAQWVPTPSWVRTENVAIPAEHVSSAGKVIIEELGASGVQQIGGTQWWQWRSKENELKGEWIEMRSHYNEQKRQGTRSRRVMLYVHGGAYFFGSVDEHRYQMQRHARKLKARVFAPRYRLAPQFPFPCGLQDCLAAYLYLLTLHDPTEIILAGDSAGGGMVLSMLCLLRDRELPLPAGAILISPWVDLTHSFPSLSGSADLDYIPSHGFMHKPSAAWPPPDDDELLTISKLANGDKGSEDEGAMAAKSTEGMADFSEHSLPAPSDELRHGAEPDAAVPIKGDGEVKPCPQLPLSIDLDGKRVILKNQIQMYTSNQLLTHPLVSPALQPSLGGLPPVMILTGGGEILRDEQIYVAHKMANPSRYPLGSALRSVYDPDDKILQKYKPTPVQLQVWDDLCHVATTLSFTRPAKFMYRSIAQFGAWTLARAQKRAIEIMDDDNISVISSMSESDSQEGVETDSLTDGSAKRCSDPKQPTGSVGRAGDPLPSFENHMIRQRVDRHGRIYPLADAHALPALQMSPDQVGAIKPGPVGKWLEAKKSWDAKYASTRTKVRKDRIKALASGEIRRFEGGERPPACALASRRTDKDLLVPRKRKSYWLAVWSMWGSRHDESTMKREEEAEKLEKRESRQGAVDGTVTAFPDVPDQHVEITPASNEVTPAASRRGSLARNRSPSATRSISHGRRRTISVSDTGQADHGDVHRSPAPTSGPDDATSPPMSATQAPLASRAPQEGRPYSPDPVLLSAGFLPKFKTASHLREDSGGHLVSDTASTMTSGTGGGAADDASTLSLFAAPGVIMPSPGHGQNSAPQAAAADRPATSPLANEVDGFDFPPSPPSKVSEQTASGAGTQKHLGSDTPRSQRSLERLQTHQQDEGMGLYEPSRSYSSTAVVRAEGVTGIVEDGFAKVDDEEKKEEDTSAGNSTGTDKSHDTIVDGTAAAAAADESERPKMYQRSETKFQTAMEKLA